MLLNAVVGIKIIPRKNLVSTGSTRKKDCCQSVSNVNYRPNVYTLLQSNNNNDNSSSEINNKYPSYHPNDDDISYSNEKAGNKSISQTVISESCKTVSDKLNKKYPSVSGSPPSRIVIVDISGNILDDDVEDENFKCILILNKVIHHQLMLIQLLSLNKLSLLKMI